MTNTERNALILVSAGLLLAMRAKAPGGHLPVLKAFLPHVEGFSEVPVWDVKQWSWGYGSKVPHCPNDKNFNCTGKISREKAWTEAQSFVDSHYKQIKPLLTARLNKNQLAALLSFSYNVGPGNARNVIPTINSGNQQAIFDHLRRYVYAGGQWNQGLLNRRNKEITLWQGKWKVSGIGANLPTWKDHIPAGVPITDYPY